MCSQFWHLYVLTSECWVPIRKHLKSWMPIHHRTRHQQWMQCFLSQEERLGWKESGWTVKAGWTCWNGWPCSQNGRPPHTKVSAPWLATWTSRKWSGENLPGRTWRLLEQLRRIGIVRLTPSYNNRAVGKQTAVAIAVVAAAA